MPDSPPQPTGNLPGSRFWTHESLSALAGDGDPVEAVISAARDLVVRGLEVGWDGPPYDPFDLADRLNIDVRPARLPVDARTVVDNGDTLTVLYNPSRPAARVRFSVAHELGHLLFPDVADQVRNRTARGALPSWEDTDDWQLELLCNIAAAEILMPTQTLQELGVHYLQIDHLLDVRAAFGVSTEALLRRVIGLTNDPATMFVASRRGGQRLSIDYRIHSPQGPVAPHIPPSTDSRLLSMRSVGERLSAVEEWGGHMVAIEAVALPPWPGSTSPRVVGILHQPGPAHLSARFTVVTGDVFPLPNSDRPQLVLHIVTDSARRLRGPFAASVTEHMPDAARAYERAVAGRPLPLPLGEAILANPLTGPALCCLVAQEGYGRSAAPRIRYAALSDALDEAAEIARRLGAKVHAPRIGTGLARGHWPLIRDLLDRAIAARDIDLTIYVPGDPA